MLCIDVSLKLKFASSLDDYEHVLAGRSKFGEDYIRHTVKDNVRNIQSLKVKVIVLDGFKEGEIHILSTDGVNYGTYEFRKTPSTIYFDHKGNGCGVKYLYAVALRRVSVSNRFCLMTKASAIYTSLFLLLLV